MDYFPNGDFAKSYQLPGIGYYMTNMPGAMTNGQPLPTQGLLTLPNAPQMDGQHYMMDGNDFAAYQQHFYQQQQLQADAPPPDPRAHQYRAGQKRKSTSTAAQRRNASIIREDSIGKEESPSKDPRRLDPFSPEASIPLPYQLGDEYSYYGPTAVWKRNERERHRVRCVNDGYDRLRNHLPLPDKEKRLSKVETLRFTIRYIHHLEKMLADSRHDEYCDCDFTVRPSSVSDSCQSPAIVTMSEQRNGTSSNGTSGTQNSKRTSSDDTSDENEDSGHR